MDYGEIVSRLAALDTASLCDADKGIRAMDPGIRPVGGLAGDGRRLIGRARTVACRDDFLAVIRALAQALPGEVLVVAGQGGHKALAGGLFATESARRGLAGLVVDGAVRDTGVLAQLDLAVYARWIHPVSGTTQEIGEVEVEINCGGVRVAPGDIVFGDADGVIVATDEELAALIPQAEAIRDTEARVFAAMQTGVSLIDQLNVDRHSAALQRGEPSRLQLKP